MSARLRRYAGHLKSLQKAKPSERKILLKKASPDLIKAICECVINILKGTVPLKTFQKNKLKTHKIILRNLQNKKININKKKKLLIQKGGFLPLLLSVLAPIISGVVGSLT